MKRQILTRKPVVVIAEKKDAHLSFVERHLSMPLIVIDAASIADEELSYVFHRGKLHITHKDQSLDNVMGVWVRRYRDFSNLALPVSAVYQNYAKSAVLRHIQGLYSHLEKARWVSDYYAIQRASYKPLQLLVASRLGFKVPDTILTSNPARAKEFIDSRPVTITKPIGVEITVKEDSSRLKLFATKIRKGDRINLSGLSLAPAIFQQAIDAAADLRVTVVSDRIFSAIITNEKLDPNSPTRDWRIGHIKGELCIEPYNLPKNIADKCIALVKRLGLEYGAIDLVLDKKNEIWFLEINSNGQWAFIEEATGQPIGKALADLLQT